MLTFADVFSGCGGMSHYFYNNTQFRGLLAVDHWPIAGKVFSYNHKNMPFELRDLYNPEEVQTVVDKLKGNCDILFGGPPCQGFSTLGKRKDNDKRCNLVEAFLYICSKVQPKIFVMENVRGITSKQHKSGKRFPEFINTYLKQRERKSDAGYDVDTLLINTVEYGLAQTRIRWILIGVRRDINKDGLLDKLIVEVEKNKVNHVAKLRDVIADLPFIESGEGADVLLTEIDGVTKKIYNHRAMNHSAELLQRLKYVPVGGGLPDVPRHLLPKHLLKMLDGKYGSGGHVKNIYGRLDWEKPAGTIVAGIDKITCGRFVHPVANRLLTPRECARIQSFPDDFVFCGSLVNQYYLIGNAVPPKISKILANSILNVLERQTKIQELNPERQSYLKSIRIS